MCIFGSRAPTPVSTPQPIQPRQPDLVSASRLPSKKELLDPDETAGVEYGTTAKADSRGAAKRTGTDALKININTGGGGEGSGGLNV
jgi:hypothetical protein|tara:strand:- start:3922 stop:4182 length:261 start_codon:yes stop_codon:yes gene_type:complete